MRSDLNINLSGLSLKNPLMNASGTFGFGAGFANIKNPEKFGALVTKTLTLKPRKGNPQPWIVKTESGLLNSVGLANEGIEAFINETLPKYRDYGLPLIVSIAGDRIADYEELARKLTLKGGIDALEINTSCPNVHNGNIPFGTDAEIIGRLVGKVKSIVKVPVFVKLTPNIGKIETVAKEAEKSGADALALINTILGIKINIKTQKPILGANTGGMSGQGIKPHGVYRVFEASKAIKIPIIGIGGISNHEDVIEYMIAGASAVGIGTANYFDPNIAEEIAEGLGEYLKENNISKISDIVGSLKLNS